MAFANQVLIWNHETMYSHKIKKKRYVERYNENKKIKNSEWHKILFSKPESISTWCTKQQVFFKDIYINQKTSKQSSILHENMWWILINLCLAIIIIPGEFWVQRCGFCQF